MQYVILDRNPLHSYVSRVLILPNYDKFDPLHNFQRKFPLVHQISFIALLINTRIVLNGPTDVTNTIYGGWRGSESQSHPKLR